MKKKSKKLPIRKDYKKKGYCFENTQPAKN